MRRSKQRHATLTQQTVDDVFARAQSQEDYIVGLFGAVIADFDNVEQVCGYPVCAEQLWHLICEKAMAWDKAHLPNVLPGGAWLNWGFRAEPTMKPWKVSLPAIRYKAGCTPALASILAS